MAYAEKIKVCKKNMGSRPFKVGIRVLFFVIYPSLGNFLRKEISIGRDTVAVRR